MASSIAGFADLRFAAAFLFLLLELQRSLSARARNPWPIIAAAGVAGLTKTEGCAVAAATIVVVALAARRQRVRVPVAIVASVFLAATVSWWPTFAALHDLPSEYPPFRSSSLSECLSPVPAVMAGLATATLALGPDGLPVWGCLWPVVLACGLVRMIVHGEREAVLACCAFALHYLGLSVVLAVLHARTGVPLELGLAAVKQRLLLHFLPWCVLLLPTAATHGTGESPAPGRDTREVGR